MIRKKGSILIFTLWFLIILAILSIVLSHRASSDIRLAKYESYNIKARYLSRAGIMKMLTELTKDTNSYDSLNEDWNRDRDNPKEFKIRDDTVFYGASDEYARLNLNGALLKKEYLVRLGIDESVSKEIIDYRIEKGDKKFEFMEELFLIEGMTRDIYREIEDLVTIYRGDDYKVNINTATQKVLEAVVGDSGLVQDILDYRRGYDGKEGTDDDDIFRDSTDISMISGLSPSLFTVRSDVFRLWAEAGFVEDKKISKGIEAVMHRTGKIYHWKEY